MNINYFKNIYNRNNLINTSLFIKTGKYPIKIESKLTGNQFKY